MSVLLVLVLGWALVIVCGVAVACVGAHPVRAPRRMRVMEACFVAACVLGIAIVVGVAIVTSQR